MAQDNSEKLHKSVDEVLRSEAGRTLFAHLFSICGYNASSTVVNPATGEVNAEATTYNEARRGVYLHLRRLASYDLLKPAEELAEKPAVTEVKKAPEEK